MERRKMHLSPDYRHRSKNAVPRGAQTFGRVVLKCYDLDEPACQIADATRSKAQTALADFADVLSTDIAGFAILHQCSTSFAFLLISTWRGNNELWQSVQHIDTPLTAFAPFDHAYPKAADLRPTFCVWELGIVAHEARAWQRYLMSDRSGAHFDTWQSDCHHGKV
jgi:hypothetical protein